MELEGASSRKYKKSQNKGSISSPQLLFDVDSNHYDEGISQHMRENEEWLEILDGVFQENSVLSNTMAERKGNGVDSDKESKDEDQLDDRDFNDPDYNLEEDDDDYHDITADNHDITVEKYSKKAKGRPQKNTNDGNNRVGLSVGILIPEINENGDSDYAESDELRERDTDKEDEVEVAYEEYNKEMDNPILELGMKFGSFKQFKEVCMNWGIKNRRQLYFKPNDSKRCVCRCKQEGCPFRVWASPVSNIDPTIQIKALNLTHTGGKVFDNSHMTPQWVARKYLNIFRADPSWDIKGLIAIVKNNYGYTIHRMKAFRAKEQALKWVETFKKVHSNFINPTNHEDHWPEVVNGGDVLPPEVGKKKRGRKPKARRKEAEELEKKKQAEAQRQAERRAEKRGEEVAPKRLSRKGLVRMKCSICKENGHNARGHHKYVDTIVPEASQQIENEDTCEYSNLYYPDIWDNSQLMINLTNQSTMTQAPSQQSYGANNEQVKVVEGDGDVNTIEVEVTNDVQVEVVEGDECVNTVEVEVANDVNDVQVEVVDLINDKQVAFSDVVRVQSAEGVSKRGRIFKKRVMKDSVCKVLKKSRK